MSGKKPKQTRQIPVTYAQTGETKFMEAPVNTKASDEAMGESSENVAPHSAGKRPEDTNHAKASSDDAVKDEAEKPKKKEIETIDEYLEAFLSGKVKSLTDKMVKRLGQNPDLDLTRRAELSALAAKADFTLDKARHLLHLSIGLGGNKRLERTLRDFAREAIIHHPVMGPQDASAWLPQSDADRALSIKAMWELFGLGLKSQNKKTENQPKEEAVKGKLADISKARRNAFFSAVVWRFAERQMSMQSIISGLRETAFRSKYETDLVETATLDLLATTQDKDAEKLGSLIRWFSDMANQAVTQADHYQRRADRLEEELSNKKALLEAKEREIEARLEETEALRKQVADVQEELRVQKVHSRDDLERQRSRTMRTLEDEIPVLTDCLTALRRDPPKVEVTKEYLESTLDKLNEELRKLKGA